MRVGVLGSYTCSQEPPESDLPPIQRVKHQPSLSLSYYRLSSSLSPPSLLLRVVFSLSLLFSFSVCLSLSLSPPVSGSLSLHVCFLLTISPCISVSVSCPGQAGPGTGCGVTGRQGSCHLFSCPHWQGAQLGRCSGILWPPCSSHQTQKPTASPPSTFCPEQEALGAGRGQGGEGIPAGLQLQDRLSWWPSFPPALPPHTSPPWFGLRSS